MSEKLPEITGTGESLGLYHRYGLNSPMPATRTWSPTTARSPTRRVVHEFAEWLKTEFKRRCDKEIVVTVGFTGANDGQ
jgi:hypothetical protein